MKTCCLLVEALFVHFVVLLLQDWGMRRSNCYYCYYSRTSYTKLTMYRGGDAGEKGKMIIIIIIITQTCGGRLDVAGEALALFLDMAGMTTLVEAGAVKEDRLHEEGAVDAEEEDAVAESVGEPEGVSAGVFA